MTPWADGCRGRACSRVVVTTLAKDHPYPSSAVGMTYQEDRRVTYEARVIITGSEDDARMAAVKFRAFLRRYQKPAGLTIRLADEQQRDERT